MATPTVAAIRRCGSRVAASDITTKVTCPGSRRVMPCERARMRHFGGKMLDTRTRLQAAMPAERSASSKEVSFSRCLPTPLVKNISFGTNPITSRSLARSLSSGGENWMVNEVYDVRKVREALQDPVNARFAPAGVNLEKLGTVCYR